MRRKVPWDVVRSWGKEVNATEYMIWVIAFCLTSLVHKAGHMGNNACLLLFCKTITSEMLNKWLDCQDCYMLPDENALGAFFVYYQRPWRSSVAPPEEYLFLHSSPLWTSCTDVPSLVWVNLRVAFGLKGGNHVREGTCLACNIECHVKQDFRSQLCFLI